MPAPRKPPVHSPILLPLSHPLHHLYANSSESSTLQYCHCILTHSALTNYDLHPDTSLEEELDFFTNASAMAGTTTSSPFIKEESDEFAFGASPFPNGQRGYNMQMGQQLGNDGNAGINPSHITSHSNTFSPSYGMENHQGMSSGFMFEKASAEIPDDELLDFDLNNGANRFGGMQQQDGNFNQYLSELDQHLQHPHGQTMNPGYASASGRLQMQNPSVQSHQNYAQMQMHHQMSHGSMAPPMDRHLSASRSPLTPRTPGVGGLSLNTQESASLPTQPIHAHSNRHQKALPNQYDSTPNSISVIDSPLSSPGNAVQHPHIHEILKTGNFNSLPANPNKKSELGTHPNTVDAKRRRRRESHNMVERRRRDNINERIQELSHLVPMHRLEDEKVRKHLANNSPLSPTLTATGTGRSPPAANSLLAPSGGRRATTAPGNISLGIPPEEKDKAPNKGDILNGAVAWTRDLMWALYVKLEQESELEQMFAAENRHWPFAKSEEEQRMCSELREALRVNGRENFNYSRGPGSGLRVPEHTDLKGDPERSGSIGGGGQGLEHQQQHGQQQQQQQQQRHMQMQMHGPGHDGMGQMWSSPDFHPKEEDEYGMDMQ